MRQNIIGLLITASTLALPVNAREQAQKESGYHFVIRQAESLGVSVSIENYQEDILQWCSVSSICAYLTLRELQKQHIGTQEQHIKIECAIEQKYWWGPPC